MSLKQRSIGVVTRIGIAKRLGDVGVAMVIVAVVAMMVVPLFPWLVDGLIALNLGFSILLLCFAVFVSNPVSFTVFPTLLLVATLYRLALNIASTRLILMQADAGQVIRAFGGYIVGQDILVGAVVFGILAMVLFLVITKGAERVAEVAARFSLDALPGMQLAIDSDLRLGAISQREATRRREALDEQSRYFGALDGAMKFVRGDAIAGLLIVGVNIVGGTLVGALRHDLSISEAVDLYGRLTVGDGLVSMIPALFVSTAAGLLVTRVGERTRKIRLGEQVTRQLMREPRALTVAACLLLSLAFVRGLPAWPFILLAFIFGLVAFKRYLMEIKNSDQTVTFDAFPESLGSGATKVEMGEQIYHTLFSSSQASRSWQQMSLNLIEGAQKRFGVPMNGFPIVMSAEMGPLTVGLKIRGGIIGEFEGIQEGACCLTDEDRLKELGVTAVGFAGAIGCWVRNEDVALIRAAGIEVVALSEGVERGILSIFESSLSRLIGVDEVQVLLDRLAQDRPVLVREAIPKRMELPELAAVLGRLADEGIHLDLLPDILENIVRIPEKKPCEEMVEDIRVGLSSHIMARLGALNAPLKLMVLDDDTSEVLTDSIVKGGYGTELAMASSDLSMIVNEIRQTASQGTRVLLTSPTLRPVLARVLRENLPDFQVLKTSEISTATSVDVVAEIVV